MKLSLDHREVLIIKMAMHAVLKETTAINMAPSSDFLDLLIKIQTAARTEETNT